MSKEIDLNDAEIQVLASLAMAEAENGPTDKATLEAGGERFSTFLQDWSHAYASLIGRGLIDGGKSAFRLTKSGRPLGERYHRERPDRYWYYYQVFYPAAHSSLAHSKLCERVFGKDLCQEGMVDMPALEDLLSRLGIRERHYVLDLGCGVGVIAEHISDLTGCRVTGLDYAEPAIQIANARAAGKDDRLNFIRADMNELDLPEQTFDAVISLDTLYWVGDLCELLHKVARSLKPGGQMGIFMVDDSGNMTPESTQAGRSLTELGLPWTAYDYTESNAEFWRRMGETAKSLHADYEAEGNGFISESLIREAEDEFLPAIESGILARYLFHVKL